MKKLAGVIKLHSGCGGVCTHTCTHTPKFKKGLEVNVFNVLKCAKEDLRDSGKRVQNLKLGWIPMLAQTPRMSLRK